jgi:hypothetical protein
LRLRIAATIVTVLVLIGGFAMISPLFFGPQQLQAEPKQVVMLSFSITESDNVTDWCRNVSSLLTSYDLPATVFLEGKTAELHPQTVACFSNKVTFGSQTYDSTNLAVISDYSLKLLEIQQGKISVDNAAKVNSTVFLAPNKITDDDIYSLLSRSGIMADFSYNDHFNLYQNGQFIKIEVEVIDAHSHSADSLLSLPQTSKPIIVQFDNGLTVQQVDSFLRGIQAGTFDFVNSSELVGFVQTRGY